MIRLLTPTAHCQVLRAANQNDSNLYPCNWMSGKYVKIFVENGLIVKIYKAKKVQHARTPKRIENSMKLHTKKICPDAMKETLKTEKA